MGSRILPAAVALGSLVVESAAGRGAAHTFLLLAIPFCAAAVLEAVGEAVDGSAGGYPVVLASATLAIVVGAAGARAPLLALACAIPLGLRGAPRALASLRRTRAPRQRTEARARAA
ncbi:MAG: hypothetical protein ABR521_00490 [Gaiellaceae bacterium]